MASLREQIGERLLALAVGALPDAKVARNVKKPTSIAPGGNVIIFDGDPGEPSEVLLSPLAYTFDHPFQFAFAAHPAATADSGTVLDNMMMAMNAAVAADRTLGGLCDFADFKAPDPQDVELFGVEPIRWADVALVVTYTTSSPLA